VAADEGKHGESRQERQDAKIAKGKQKNSFFLALLESWRFSLPWADRL
jgi:hypothetical protein